MHTNLPLDSLLEAQQFLGEHDLHLQQKQQQLPKKNIKKLVKYKLYAKKIP